MPNPTFPIPSRQDSKFFGISQENVAVKGELEGGYSHSRPRTTRAPRKTFETGFSEITRDELDDLQEFYDLVGQHSIFDYIHPRTLAVHACRFESWPTAQFVGHGSHERYNLSVIQIKEV